MNNKIGVIASLYADRSCFAQMKQHGLNVCQLCSWDPALWTGALAEKVRREADAGGIHMTSLWAGWRGPSAWNFTEGPITLGLVPPAYRYQRVQELMQAGQFAKALGVTHEADGILRTDRMPRALDILRRSRLCLWKSGFRQLCRSIERPLQRSGVAAVR